VREPRCSKGEVNENPSPWQQHSKLKTQFHNATSGSITIDGNRSAKDYKNYSHSAIKKSEQASLMCYEEGRTAAIRIINELALL
jgi:hypothetical protein